MQQVRLVGYNALNALVQYAKDVDHYASIGKYGTYFRVSVPKNGQLELTTLKGTYILKKHTQLNLYMGECAGRKVHVTLQKITGKVIWY